MRHSKQTWALPNIGYRRRTWAPHWSHTSSRSIRDLSGGTIWDLSSRNDIPCSERPPRNRSKRFRLLDMGYLLMYERRPGQRGTGLRLMSSWWGKRAGVVRPAVLAVRASMDLLHCRAFSVTRLRAVDIDVGVDVVGVSAMVFIFIFDVWVLRTQSTFSCALQSHLLGYCSPRCQSGPRFRAGHTRMDNGQ